MRNFLKIILLSGISLLLLIGCSSSKEEKTIDMFINKLLSIKSYESITLSEDVDKYTDDAKINFGEYLTDDAFNIFMANRIPIVYYTVINKNNIIDITDIKIVKSKETDADKYIHYEYEVSYKLKSSDSSMDMIDNMVFKVMKDNPDIIDEIYVVDKTSSIFSQYKSIAE